MNVMTMTIIVIITMMMGLGRRLHVRQPRLFMVRITPTSMKE